ncbi:MAG: cation-translocating P-type ATPase [Selenomonadaceae bacterium]|nr:cation-translocating P-type ATPase [Selenomonadaceae bacterium]MBQ7493341.1 cation-translocating P-type ATPase [Selenomonadaceae bacterium]
MKQIISLFVLDALISGAVAAWLYFARGEYAALITGLSIFIALSPICLIFASPFTLYLAKRKIAKLGVKCNNFNALKILKDVNVLALPYNRVLTGGEFYITDLVPEGLNQPTLLAMAAGAETDAENVLGKVIYDTATLRSLRLQPSTNFKELPGRGVEATVSGVTMRVGNPAWLESFNVSISANLRTKIDQLLVKGKTVLVVATGRAARGLIALKDDINDAAINFLGSVKAANIETLLLTAQPKKMTSFITKNFALDNIRTNLTPEGKAREVQIFRAKGKVVAAIGTDAHDLPALKNADVSFLIRNEELGIRNDDAKLDFEIPKLESFLAVKATALNVSKTLKINRILALLSWIILVPPAIMTALENPPIPWHPLAAVVGVVIFSAIILANSLRTS